MAAEEASPQQGSRRARLTPKRHEGKEIGTRGKTRLSIVSFTRPAIASVMISRCVRCPPEKLRGTAGPLAGNSTFQKSLGVFTRPSPEGDIASGFWGLRSLFDVRPTRAGTHRYRPATSA